MELTATQGLDINPFNKLFRAYQQRFIRFVQGDVPDATMTEDRVLEGFAAAGEHRTTWVYEAFSCHDAANCTRPWFAWQNTLFGEWMVKLVNDGTADTLN